MQRNLRHARHRGQVEKYSGSAGDEDPIQPRARRRSVGGDCSSGCARTYKIFVNSITERFSFGSATPVHVFSARNGSQRDRACTGGHQERTGDDPSVMTGGHAMQLAEDEKAPKQSPKLIGVGKRNASADSQIFCGVLLK